MSPAGGHRWPYPDGRSEIAQEATDLACATACGGAGGRSLPGRTSVFDRLGFGVDASGVAVVVFAGQGGVDGVVVESQTADEGVDGRQVRAGSGYRVAAFTDLTQELKDRDRRVAARSQPRPAPAVSPRPAAGYPGKARSAPCRETCTPSARNTRALARPANSRTTAPTCADRRDCSPLKTLQHPTDLFPERHPQ